MHRWNKKLYPLACGGVTLGILQSFEAIDFNEIWYEFLYVILNALVSLLFGNEATTLADSGSASLLASFFA